ncbi:hypothetical protein [uncultured Lutibacter sp.]|uniref:hypothetical protein n=1 Tax=uncultured Lutibacter sp. TaxID=437739 RepID=UPI0026394FAE|nr:hypothetical protein [uncultured Lutibacter sp.]
MKSKLLNLTLLILISSKSFAQEEPTIIHGRIQNIINKPLSDIHVINLNNKQGTISNLNGTFEIVANENDVILFSSIQYHNKKVIISNNILQLKHFNIELLPLVNELEEVYLHGLTGSLNLDFKKVPKDTIPKHTFSYNYEDVRKLGDDFNIELNKPPDAEALVNPILMNGVGASVSIPNYQLIAEQKQKRELKQKKSFPIQLKKELGTDYFVNLLKIPPDEIFIFIDYCEPYNILEKYYNNKVLEVIEILKKQSIAYNEKK